MENKEYRTILNEKKILILATDTEAGKTSYSLEIYKKLKKDNKDPGYFKLVGAGRKKVKTKYYNEDYYELKKAGYKEDEKLCVGLNFSNPLSPNIAARKEKKKIEINQIYKKFSILKKKYEYLTVEGTGGLYVPVDEEKNIFMIDIYKKINLPAIVISKAFLGTINHTLMTINFLKKRKIRILYLVLNFYNKKNPVHRENLNYFKRTLKFPVYIKEQKTK